MNTDMPESEPSPRRDPRMRGPACLSLLPVLSVMTLFVVIRAIRGQLRLNSSGLARIAG